ncbi:MAG: ATP-binding protein [Deltaproteobacteria bacterium]|nr:ATP-binding protein [Deltaproteobacteria bacterium]
MVDMKLSPVVTTWAFSNELLARRMSFLSGPRQVGKTTSALMHLEKLGQIEHYYNFDTITVRRKFTANPLFFLENIPEPPRPPAAGGEPKHWVVFDEIHKNPAWKQLLKGFSDEFGHFIRFLVCGSAKLDTYRRGGESLLGRYFLFKMFPLGPKDVVEGDGFDLTRAWIPGQAPDLSRPSREFAEAVDSLWNLTGFPEPFLKGSKSFYRRWLDEHLSLLTTQEVRDLSRISDLVRLQSLALLLPERVGSLLNVHNLAQTLSVAHNTVAVWLDAMEQVFLIFRVPPYSARLSTSIKKARKSYFWDWGLVEDTGKRFENFLAVQLSRTVSAWNEWGVSGFSLHFVRTKDGKETDFLIVRNKKPVLLVEAKLSDIEPDRNLLYFKKALDVDLAFQVVLNDDFLKQAAPGLFVTDIHRFLNLLV